MQVTGTHGMATSLILSSSSGVSPSMSAQPNGTVLPTPTSTAVPSSSAKPHPTPTPLPYGTYNVKSSENGSYCLLAQFNAVLHVNYLSSDNESSNATVNETAAVGIPHPGEEASVKVSGSCGNKSSSLVVVWLSSRFEIHFGTYHPDTNETSVTYWKISEMKLFIDTKNNSKFKNPVSDVNVTAQDIDVKGPLHSGYWCRSSASYKLSENVKVDLDHVKLQPFDATNSTYNDKVIECPNDNPTPKPKGGDNNIVPIAVGCALAGLVLIVLIAYIIGRRKSQRGYEKV